MLNSRARHLTRDDYEKAALSAVIPSVRIAHQPKTMANAAPFLTLLTLVNPIAVKTSVQIIKTSSAVAKPYTNAPSAGFRK